jgi:hypothetical protein
VDNFFGECLLHVSTFVNKLLHLYNVSLLKYAPACVLLRRHSTAVKKSFAMLLI